MLEYRFLLVPLLGHFSVSVAFPGYYKFGNFRENFVFANNVKRHICEVKNSRLGHNLTISVNDRVISPLHEGFIFKKLRMCEVSRK